MGKINSTLDIVGKMNFLYKDHLDPKEIDIKFRWIIMNPRLKYIYLSDNILDIEFVGKLINVAKDVFKGIIKYPSSHYDIAIRHACKNNYISSLRIILEEPKIHLQLDDKTWDYMMEISSLYGYYNIIKILIDEFNMPADYNNNYPFKMASKYGYIDIVEMLLQKSEVDPFVDKNYPMRMAKKNGHKKIVEISINLKSFYNQH